MNWPEILKGIEESNISNYSDYIRKSSSSLVIGSITEMTLLQTCRRLPMIQSPKSGGPSVCPHRGTPVKSEDIGL